MSDSRVFVSYSRADKPQVLDIIRRIESDAGVKCWIDLTGIESGSQFEDIIIKAIDRSEVFLLMVSDSFLQSQWTKREVYYAESQGKRIVPISVDGRPLRGWVSFHFGHIDFIDSTSPEQVSKLCSNIRSWLGAGAESGRMDSYSPVALLPSAPIHAVKERKNRRWLIPVLSVALLMGVAGFLLMRNHHPTSSLATYALEVPADSVEENNTSEALPSEVLSKGNAPYREPSAPRSNPVKPQTSSPSPSRSALTSPDPADIPAEVSSMVSSQESILSESPAAAQIQTPKPSASTHGVSNGHAWVDLGTGVKWAVANIGASTPGDPGAYYAWGELNTKNDYSWSSYRFGGSSSGITKYCSTPNDGMDGFTDMITKLLDEDDIAHNEWGGGWRLPTSTELKAMISACTSSWTTRNGQEGMLFTSKTTGEEVFFPAAGFRTNAGFNGVGQSGRYWSSSLNADGSTSAWGLYFDSSNSNTRSNKRVNGFTIRPVIE